MKRFSVSLKLSHRIFDIAKRSYSHLYIITRSKNIINNIKHYDRNCNNIITYFSSINNNNNNDYNDIESILNSIPEYVQGNTAYNLGDYNLAILNFERVSDMLHHIMPSTSLHSAVIIEKLIRFYEKTYNFQKAIKLINYKLCHTISNREKVLLWLWKTKFQFYVSKDDKDMIICLQYALKSLDVLENECHDLMVDDLFYICHGYIGICYYYTTSYQKTEIHTESYLQASARWSTNNSTLASLIALNNLGYCLLSNKADLYKWRFNQIVNPIYHRKLENVEGYENIAKDAIGYLEEALQIANTTYHTNDNIINSSLLCGQNLTNVDSKNPSDSDILMNNLKNVGLSLES